MASDPNPLKLGFEILPLLVDLRLEEGSGAFLAFALQLLDSVIEVFDLPFRQALGTCSLLASTMLILLFELGRSIVEFVAKPYSHSARGIRVRT